MHLYSAVIDNRSLSKACGREVMIFAPSVERGWNGSCIGKLPDPLPCRRRHKNGGWKWGWLRQTISGSGTEPRARPPVVYYNCTVFSMDRPGHTL